MRTTKFLIAAAVFALCFFAACTKNETDEATKSQVVTLTKQVDSLKTEQNSIKEDLAELGLDVDVVADTVDTLVKRYHIIDAEIDDIYEELAEMDKTVNELQNAIDEVKAEQRTMFDSINARLSRLENRVQSIVVIPDYSTGEIKVDVTKTYIIAHIRPFAVADSLVKLHAKYENIFKVAAVQRETKAIPVQNLSIDTVEFHPTDDSTVMIKADVAELSLESNNYVVSLSVTSGNIQKQSEYFPLKQTFPDSLSFWGTPQKWDWEKPKQTIKRVAPGIYEDTVSQYEWPKVSEEYYSGYFFTPWASADIDGRYFKTYTGSVSISSYENQIQFLNNGTAALGAYSVLINLNDRSIAAYYHATKGYKYLGDTLYFHHKTSEYGNQKLVKVDYGKYTGIIIVPDSAAHGQFPIEKNWGSHGAGAINAGSFIKQEGVHQAGESLGYDTVFEGDGSKETGEGGAYWVEMDFYNSKMTATKLKNMVIFGGISEWKPVSMQLDTSNLRFSVNASSLKLDCDAYFIMTELEGENWTIPFDGKWDDVNHIDWSKRSPDEYHWISHTTQSGQNFNFYPTRQKANTSDGKCTMYCTQSE